MNIDDFPKHLLEPIKTHFTTITIEADCGMEAPTFVEYSFNDDDSEKTRAQRKKDAIERLKRAVATRLYNPNATVFRYREDLIHSTITHFLNLESL